MSDLKSKITSAMDMLQSLLDVSSQQGHKLLVAFSGGKESILLADMLKQHKQAIELVWCNTQAMFPHMIEFVRAYRDKGYALVELQSDQPARLLREGLPSSVVPIDFMFSKPGRPLKISDYITCCHELRSFPIAEYAVSKNNLLVVDGQRQQDGILNRNGKTMTPAYNGHSIQVTSPIWDWTTDEVMAYIQENGLELPSQYPQVMDSLECWSCTHNPTKQKIDYMRREYPELLQDLKPMLSYVYTNTISELDSQLKGAAYANASQL